MSNQLRFLSIATTLTISFGYGNIAQAATVTSSGIWSAASGTDRILGVSDGVGTNQISWGNPYPTNNPQSSYQFQSVSNVPLPMNETYFSLGTFTHNNFLITGDRLSGANLALTLNINNNSNSSQTFNFLFDHNETRNDGVDGSGVCSDTPSFGPLCPDVVSIVNTESTETLSIDGLAYKLIVNGFEPNANPISQFITLEEQVNNIQLFGRLQQVPSAPVPEPLTILGTVTALGFGGFFKRKQSKANKEKVNI